MGSEYVLLNSLERSYGEKILLHTQLELLDSLKRFEIFRELRREEFISKIAIKNKVQNILEELNKIEGFLPKAQYKVHGFVEDFEEKQKNGETPLQEEIEEIKRKLERLQKVI